jgi:hypothetical protein
MIAGWGTTSRQANSAGMDGAMPNNLQVGGGGRW